MKVLHIAILLILSLSVSAQDFRMPMDIPPQLSGSFGELRDNHLHSGIDFRTQEKEGIPVYAVADGVLSRVFVSATGFGKAVYINHDDDKTSVYAHLSGFNDKISQLVKTQQYKNESFELNYFPNEKIIIRKGDLIGYSGNSGSSGGPHLHFELRETASEKIINPALYGFKTPDNCSPFIESIAIGGHQPVKISTDKNVLLKDTFPVFEGEEVYFDLNAYDFEDENPSNLGLYSLKAFVDDTLFFSYQMDKFAFDESRYVNALIDYGHYVLNHGERFQRTQILPGNKLSIYKNVKNNGILLFREVGKKHKIRFEAADVNGNTTVLELFVCVMKTSDFKDVIIKYNNFFYYGGPNEFKNDEIEVEMPEGAIYTSFPFDCKQYKSSQNYYSNKWAVGIYTKPVHKNYRLRIKTYNVPKKHQTKLVVASFDENDKLIAEGGTYKDGWMDINIKKFCTFVVAVDTVTPKIEAVKLPSTNSNQLEFRITDDFSGIKSYRTTIDGKWLLMEYDAKTSRLTGVLDQDFPKGEHKIRLEVVDKVGNKTVIGKIIKI